MNGSENPELLNSDIQDTDSYSVKISPDRITIVNKKIYIKF